MTTELQVRDHKWCLKELRRKFLTGWCALSQLRVHVYDGPDLVTDVLGQEVSDQVSSLAVLPGDHPALVVFPVVTHRPSVAGDRYSWGWRVCRPTLQALAGGEVENDLDELGVFSTERDTLNFLWGECAVLLAGEAVDVEEAEDR